MTDEDGFNWVEAFSKKAWGESGRFGIKILIATDHPITDAEKTVFYRAEEQIQDAVMTESIRRNPEEQDRAKMQREFILGLFPQPIFVEEIPNGYCNRWCCKHLPWFIVTTTRGRITIGWRKRVIEITWDKCVGPEARELFPTEQVTMGERYIHAWGYEKAREYMGKLLAGGGV